GLFLWIDDERDPQLSRHRELESRRHNPDHRITVTIQLDCLIDYRSIAAELLLPESIAQQHHLIFPGLLFFRYKSPPERRADSQHGHQVSADACSRDSLWLTSPGEIESRQLQRRHFLKRRLLVLPVLEVWNGDRRFIQTLPEITFRKSHEPIGIFVRKRLQDYGIEDTEDRQIAADTERRGKYDSERKSRVLSQNASGIAQVL